MNNRRRSARVERHLPVQVEGQPSRLLDISATGARVQVTDTLFLGGCVELQVREDFCLRGRAVWQRGDQAGVAFHDLDLEEERQLAQLLATPRPWKLILCLGVLGGAATLNFLVSQLVQYYTLWMVTYGI